MVGVKKDIQAKVRIEEVDSNLWSNMKDLNK